MDRFEFSENAAFYQVKEEKNLDEIVPLFINELKEKVGADCYDCIIQKETMIEGMKYSFFAYKRDKRPICIKEEIKLEEEWHEKLFAYLLIVEYRSYVAIIKRNMENIRAIRNALKIIDYNVLCKILQDKNTIYKRFGMNNLDISNYAMRSKVYEAEDLKASFSTLGASNYALGNFRIKNNQGSFSIGLTDSKINHLLVKSGFEKLILWCKEIIDKVATTSDREVNNYLSIFATPVDYMKEFENGKLKARYVLVSLYKLYQEDWIVKITDIDTKKKIDIDTICEKFQYVFVLRDEGDGNYSYSIDVDTKIEINVSERGVSFMCNWMKKILLWRDKVNNADDNYITLWDWVIENSAYTVMFKSPKLKYTNRKLFKDNRLTGNIEMFLEVFEHDDALADMRGEKEYEQDRLTNDSKSFPKYSLFRYVEDKYKKGRTIMVCDDLGTEWADHIRIGEDSVALFAAKHKERGFSASAFQEVVGQAQKNLGVFFPLETQWRSKEKKWDGEYKLNQVNTKIKRVRTPEKTAKDAINLWKKAERNANFKRDLYIVIDFLSKSELEENLMKLRERTDFAKKNETIPMLWLISSLWSSCQELNVRLHVTCRK